MQNDDDDGAGYRKPPKQHQFTPGKSGNPRGRPRKSNAMGDEIDRALSERVSVVERGVSKTITMRAATAKQLVTNSLKGDMRATKMVIAEQRHQSQIAVPAEAPPLTDRDEEIIDILIERIVCYLRDAE
jgi:hypothetical protein